VVVIYHNKDVKGKNKESITKDNNDKNKLTAEVHMCFLFFGQTNDRMLNQKTF